MCAIIFLRGTFMTKKQTNKSIRIEKKAKKVFKIVEENCELTDEEKKTILLKLQEEVKSKLQSLEKISKFKGKLYQTSIDYGNDGALGVYTGIIAIFLFMLGFLGAFASADEQLYLSTAFCGGSSLVGLVGAINSFMNVSPDEDENELPYVMQLNEKRLNAEKYVRNALQKINKTISEMLEKFDVEEKEL